MICSARELGLGDDHSGIIVLPPDLAPPGTDVVELRRARRRGARPGGHARTGGTRCRCAASPGSWRTPRRAVHATRPSRGCPATSAPCAPAYPVSIEDPTGCDRFARARSAASTRPRRPRWMQQRLARAGRHPVDRLAVDITNYVMLELGQPMHAFDRRPAHRARSWCGGPGRGRRWPPWTRGRARSTRTTSLITDDSGPDLAGRVMGGETTEVGREPRDVLFEAAHWDPATVARTARRHKLSSEASKRFERGVDPTLPPSRLGPRGRAAGAHERRHGGARLLDRGCGRRAGHHRHAGRLPGSGAGLVYGLDTVLARLREVGCTIVQAPEKRQPSPRGQLPRMPRSSSTPRPAWPTDSIRAGTLRHDHGKHDRSGVVLLVTPPIWRPDLTDPADLAEEVIRLEGYDNIPSVPPGAPRGRGLTERQRLRRTLGRSLADTRLRRGAEHPFVGRGLRQASAARRRPAPPGGPAGQPALRRRAAAAHHAAAGLLGRCAQPRPRLQRRGALRVRPRSSGRGRTRRRPAPILRPTAVPPTRAGAAGGGAAGPAAARRRGARRRLEPPGWWGEGRPAGWADAIEAARDVLPASRLQFDVRADQHEPWHPGRCAAIFVQTQQGHEWLAGHAGELHPRVSRRWACRPDRRDGAGHVRDRGAADATRARCRHRSRLAFPPALQDVALVVRQSCRPPRWSGPWPTGRPSRDVIWSRCGLFDVYTGEQAGEGRKSLAYTLRFRAPDRTLTAEEASAARDAAVAEAARRTGAVLRRPRTRSRSTPGA